MYVHFKAILTAVLVDLHHVYSSVLDFIQQLHQLCSILCLTFNYTFLTVIIFNFNATFTVVMFDVTIF